MALDQANIVIERLARAEEPNRLAWRVAIGAAAPLDADILKRDGGTTVWRAHLMARDVVIKSWTGTARLKHLFGLARPDRHWLGAQWLEAQGIATARCLASAVSRRMRPRTRWLVMESLSGRTLLEHLAQRDLLPRQQHALARAIARQLVAITLAGRYNRDHKPSNLIVLNADTPEPTVAIIDTVAINKLRFWRPADLYAMFASLVIEPTGCGCPPRRSLMMRVLVEHQRELLRRIPNMLDPALRRAARHRDWMRIAGIIDAHGDPTPRINPLAEA